MAGTIPVPVVPESAFADTEAVTNAAARPSLVQRARTFSGDIALYATPSNALEVAFGTSRNSDGILLPGDETFSIGWVQGSSPAELIVRQHDSPTSLWRRGKVEGRMIKRLECWEQKILLPMHEHRFLIADHNLPGPSESEGPRHVPGIAR